MIKLFSQRLMIKDQDGCRRSVSFDSIRNDLNECFIECEIKEQWLAEHLVMAIEEQLRNFCSEENRPTSEDELDQIVAQVLINTGYEDVAMTFSNKRELTPVDSIGAPLLAWGEERLDIVLSNALPSATKNNKNLKLQIMRALNAMQFSLVSDDFVCQLANHFLQNGHAKKCSHKVDINNPWLLEAGELTILFSGALIDLIELGVIEIYPISRLVPRARVGLHLDKLGKWIGYLPLTEITVLPKVAQLTALLYKALRYIRAELREKDNHADSYPAYLQVLGLQELIKSDLVPLCPRDEKKFIKDLGAIIKQEVSKSSSFAIILNNR